jgi:hypothetical protein
MSAREPKSIAQAGSEDTASTSKVAQPKADPDRIRALKQKILLTRPGTQVRVRLKDNQKLTGFLGEFSNDGFDLKLTRKSPKLNQVDIRRISFNELKGFGEIHTGFCSSGGCAFILGFTFGVTAPISVPLGLLGLSE